MPPTQRSFISSLYTHSHCLRWKRVEWQQQQRLSVETGERDGYSLPVRSLLRIFFIIYFSSLWHVDSKCPLSTSSSPFIHRLSFCCWAELLFAQFWFFDIFFLSSSVDSTWNTFFFVPFLVVFSCFSFHRNALCECVCVCVCRWCQRSRKWLRIIGILHVVLSFFQFFSSIFVYTKYFYLFPTFFPFFCLQRVCTTSAQNAEMKLKNCINCRMSILRFVSFWVNHILWAVSDSNALWRSKWVEEEREKENSLIPNALRSLIRIQKLNEGNKI